MSRFRKKPIIIEAEQFHADAINYPWGVCLCSLNPSPHVHTAHNSQLVVLTDGDWIIPEPDGVHYYPCKPDIFAATYESIRGR